MSAGNTSLLRSTFFFLIGLCGFASLFLANPLLREISFSKESWINFKTPRYKNEEAELWRRLTNATDQKLIIVWHKPPWVRRAGGVDKSQCGNCLVTLDKAKINDSRVGAVIIYYQGIKANNMPPQKYRTPDQLHILRHGEPPGHILNHKYAFTTNYEFNASISYRRSADFIGNSFGSVIPRVMRVNISKSKILTMKKRLALSLISNCGSTPGASARFKIVKRLQTLGLAVDGYGGCFNDKSLEKHSQESSNFIKQFKFYLSFENSYHCQDYITEKVYQNGFASFAVPIVWGATKEDYATYLPKGSYIFAEGYETLESLIEYINYLDKNDTAYLEYFEWHQRKMPKWPVPPPGINCQVCQALHGINIYEKNRRNYNQKNPRIPAFTDGVAKRHLPPVRSYIFGQDNKECGDEKPDNWKFYKNWKLAQDIQQTNSR